MSYLFHKYLYTVFLMPDTDLNTWQILNYWIPLLPLLAAALSISMCHRLNVFIPPKIRKLKPNPQWDGIKR